MAEQRAPGLWRTVHRGAECRSGNAAEIATYVVDKRKPLLTLAE